MTALKATKLAEDTILPFMTQRELNRANLIAAPVQRILPYLHFNPWLRAMGVRLLSLPSNKAPSCKKVIAKIPKESSPVIAPITTSHINDSFTLSTFTVSLLLLLLPWKRAEIVPILKSGDSEEPANMRPILLLPILSRVRERAVYLQFTNFSHKTMSYITCKVEIENFTLPSLGYLIIYRYIA